MFWNYIVMMVVQPHEYSKTPVNRTLKKDAFIVCERYLNKKLQDIIFVDY